MNVLLLIIDDGANPINIVVVYLYNLKRSNPLELELVLLARRTTTTNKNPIANLKLDVFHILPVVLLLLKLLSNGGLNVSNVFMHLV